jgi:hypothetical protein
MIILMVATSIVVACGGDDESTVVPCALCSCDPALCAPALTTREDVLVSIENAYNKRRVDWLDSSIDENFIFYLAPGDVVGSMPDSWGRVDEVDLSVHLFDKNYTALPCQSIFMDIKSEDGLSWVEVIPESAPTETWYQTTLFYNFRFDISPNTFIPNTGSKAVFTVRNAGTTEDPHWQLVEMRDLGGAPIMNATAAATEPTTWGGVKVMYR